MIAIIVEIIRVIKTILFLITSNDANASSLSISDSITQLTSSILNGVYELNTGMPL